MGQAMTAKNGHEVGPLSVQEAEVDMEAVTSQETAHILKEATNVISIIETPSYIESMLEEAQGA